MIYAFGDHHVDDERYVLTVDGEERPIEPQVFEVLLFLIRHRGRVVSKEEILDAVWGDRFVSESALTTRIKAARRAVDDDGAAQRVIRTSHGKGYEFVATVTTHTPTSSDEPADDAPTSRLPLGLHSLVGRDAEKADIATEIVDSRLVTLVGPAGVGKTALAYAVARAAESTFDGGAYLCELVEVTTPDATAKALATALDVSVRRGTSLDDSIVDVLRPLNALVVLDNCEHVVEHIGTLVGRILRAAPDVTVLATSREPLGVAGERVTPVAPLPVDPPDVDADADPDLIPAVTLFADRAREADPSFVLDANTTPAVVEICRRLDGIPLAIELAAARTRSLDVADIAERLHERFRLLRSVRREGDRRHHTLADAVQWSYDLLPAPEQGLFGRLSVFAGAFDLGAVEEICSDDAAPEPLDPAEQAHVAVEADVDVEVDLVDGVSRLVDRSMVSVRRHPRAGTSYELLETMREFGRTSLPDTERTRLVRRHRDHYVRLAIAVEQSAMGPNEPRQMARADAAFADLRAAQRSALENGDLDSAFTLISALREYAMRTMRYEVLSWADRAVAAPAAEGHKLFATMLGIQAYASWIRGEFDRALELAARATAIEKDRAIEPSGIPERVVANVRFVLGDYDAGRNMTERQLELAEASGVPSRIVHAAYMQSVAYSVRHRDRSRELAERAHHVAQMSASPTDLASAWVARGFIADDVDEGVECFAHSDELARSAGNRWMSTFARTEMYGLMVERGDHDAARHGLAEVVDTWFRSGEWSQQWLTLGTCLVSLAAIGEHEAAAEVAGAVARRSAIGATPVVATLRARALDAEQALEARLGADAYEQHRAVGGQMSDVDVVQRARNALLGVNVS